ncbi:hypothetical protein BDR04DRAFT_1116446 [Suillus decipiens]|nr:hypothetical protein BDR04DRAFT_1116446 [Suillus decipiens]
MSCTLLAQMAELQAKATLQEAQKSSSKTLALLSSCVSQSFGDDLKSLFYVFTYICIKYSSSNGEECKESIHDSLPDSWSTLNLDGCKLRKVYFFAVSSEEACLKRQFHPYFAKLIPLAKEWQAILRDNMKTRITFDSIINLLEHHLATLQDDKEHSSINKDLRKSAEELTCHMKNISLPQLAKWKRCEAANSYLYLSSSHTSHRKKQFLLEFDLLGRHHEQWYQILVWRLAHQGVENMGKTVMNWDSS